MKEPDTVGYSAAHSVTPMVPVTLTSTRGLLRGEELHPHYSKLQILIGTPLSAEGDDWQVALQLRETHASRFWRDWVSLMRAKG